MKEQLFLEHAEIKFAADVALDCYEKEKLENSFKSNLGVQGHVSIYGNHVILGFAGTNEPKDWREHIKSLFLSLIPFSHQGEGAYHDAFDSVKPQIDKIILPLLSNPNKKFVITGHSYGGSIAGRAAIAYATEGYSSTVVSFSEPNYLSVKEVDNLSLIIKKRITYFRVFHPLDFLGNLPLRFKHYPKARKAPVWFFGNPHDMNKISSIL